MPSADDLFRPTVVPAAGEDAAPAPVAESAPVAADQPEDEESSERKPSGRVRHDEKMTVYMTADELLDLEQARLTMRRHHGLAVDRGRLVREAVAIALADLEESGADSLLVSRLTSP